MDGNPSGCVYYCLSNLDLEAHTRVCPRGATHGIAWGNRSLYGRESGAGSTRLQHESQFLKGLLKGAESTRPPWRCEVPPVPDSI
eukprot:329141-Lingulodinium_polyedra.AAC.1